MVVSPQTHNHVCQVNHAISLAFSYTHENVSQINPVISFADLFWHLFQLVQVIEITKLADIYIQYLHTLI